MLKENQKFDINVSSVTFNKGSRLFNLSIGIKSEDDALSGMYGIVKFLDNKIVLSLSDNREFYSSRYMSAPIRLRRKTKKSKLMYFGVSKRTALTAMREWGCYKWLSEPLKTTGVYSDGKIIIDIDGVDTISIDDLSRSFNLFTPGSLSSKSENKTVTIDGDGNPIYEMPDNDSFYILKRQMVTPEFASELLKLNIKNRDASPKNIHKVIHGIMSGAWDVNNGETVKINTKNEIVDGQHRLMAIIHTGVTVPLTIAFGVSENAQETIDTGRSRNGADILSIEGFKVPKKAAGVLNKLAFLNGETVSAEYKANCSTTWSNADLLVYASDNEEDLARAHSLFDSMIYKSNSVCKKYISLALAIIFMRKSEEKALEFMSGVFSGYNLQEGSPAATLRVKLFESERKRARNPRNRIDDYDIALWFIKAWNAYLTGKSIKQSNLRLNRNESLPEILGINP